LLTFAVQVELSEGVDAEARGIDLWLRAEKGQRRLDVGTSYGGATVVFVAAVDPRVKCVVSVVGVGNGARWMRSIRRPALKARRS
jgi:hypothetical protein